MINQFAWAALTNLAQIHVITITNWTKYYTNCIFLDFPKSPISEYSDTNVFKH